MDTYKDASVWCEFANIRESAVNAIEVVTSEETIAHNTDVYTPRGQKADSNYKGIVFNNGKKRTR